MRKSLIGLTATAALALTACGGPHRPDPRGVGPDEVLVQISATGRADSKPDQAGFSVGVSSIGATSEAATATNNGKMNAVLAALKAQGIAEDDMQTQQVTVSRQDWGPNKGKFEASNVINVKVRAVDKAGAAIGAATKVGANVLSGPNLTVADPEAAGRGAYAAAFKAARARADTYAEAAGLKVVRVLAIRDSAAPPPMPMAEAYAADKVMLQANVAPPVLAGTNTSQATVNVDFALGPK
jgi:uncharacterized protein YggE